MTIGERIKQRRKELKMSQDELAKRIGYKSRSSINKIEMGLYELQQAKIKDIANALDTTPAYIMGWDAEENLKRIHYELNMFEQFGLKPLSIQKFPLLGEIACGEPIFANESRESYIEAGTDVKADFCLQAKGDSMINARIYDGDIVFVKKQDIVDNGDIAVVIIEDSVTLKRVFYDRENETLILQSENPKYQPFVYSGEQLERIHILGKAVAFQSDVN